MVPFRVQMIKLGMYFSVQLPCDWLCVCLMQLEASPRTTHPRHSWPNCWWPSCIMEAWKKRKKRQHCSFCCMSIWNNCPGSQPHIHSISPSVGQSVSHSPRQSLFRERGEVGSVSWDKAPLCLNEVILNLGICFSQCASTLSFYKHLCTKNSSSLVMLL